MMILFTGMDTNLYYVRTSASGASTPVPLCAPGRCLATSDRGPVAVLDRCRTPLVVFHGTDRHIYSASWTDQALFTAPVEATGGELSDLAPGLASGLDDATAELVYVRVSDGRPRHTRLQAGWSAAITVADVGLTAAPALVALP
jgi:hypothetical protein